MVVFLAACGSGGPAAQIDGEWRGTWNSNTGPGGSVTADFEQVGSNLSGTISLSGSPCLTNGTISGSSDAGGATFGAVEGSHRITFTARSEGANRMSGTYSVGAGRCMGDTGHFDVTRVR